MSAHTGGAGPPAGSEGRALAGVWAESCKGFGQNPCRGLGRALQGVWAESSQGFGQAPARGLGRALAGVWADPLTTHYHLLI